MTSSLRGRSSVPVRTVCIPKAGQREHDRGAGRRRRPTSDRALEHLGQDRSPRRGSRRCCCAGRAGTGTRPFSMRSPSHGEHGRHDGDRADHRDRDDHDRADAERGEGAPAGEEHAGHGDHHGEAGDEHGAARGRGRRVDRLELARARAPSPRARGAGRTACSRRPPPGRRAGPPSSRCRPSGTNWLGIATRPSVAMTAVSPSSSGTPAATSAPKARIEDDQRDRQREQLGLLEVVLERLRERLVGAGAAELRRRRRSGCAALTLVDRRRRPGRSRLLVWSSSPRTLNSTSTERPSLEIWPSLPLA